MLYTAKDLGIRKEWEEHHLLPSARLESRVVMPAVITGSDIVRENIRPRGTRYTREYNEKFMKLRRTLEELVQPCSVDLYLKEWFTSDGKHLEYPVRIESGGAVVGDTGIDLHIIDSRAICCLETRSGAARKGLVGMDFHLGNRHSFNEPTPFLYAGEYEVKVTIQNHSPNTFVIQQPISPVQISFTSEVDSELLYPQPIAIIRNGEDVTEQNKVQFGKFLAYKLHLAEESQFMQRFPKEIDITEVDLKQHYRQVRADELPQYNPEFCLTLSEEEVRTNGCPCYVFPFHYLDAQEHFPHMDDLGLEALAKYFYQTFSDTRLLPVTGNAGLHNPGSTGRIVFENITKGRDVKRYFRIGEPFGLLIPVPFLDGGIDNGGYRGKYGNQNSISL